MLHVQPLLNYSGAANAPEIDMDSDIDSEVGLGIDGIFGIPVSYVYHLMHCGAMH